MLDPVQRGDEWAMLIPGLRKIWPKLDDSDFCQIAGNLELLVTKVSDRYGIKRAEVLQHVEQLRSSHR